jgi:NitT/TauT family transport system substrate-binding protein
MSATGRGGVPIPRTQTRRRFLTTAALAGAAGLVRAPRLLAAERALETTSVRLQKSAALCIAPVYVVEGLLRAEGFTDIRYVDFSDPTAAIKAAARGEIDFVLNYAVNYLAAIDAGEPITLLAGVHVGCFELFGGEGIRSIADLKGKSVGVQALGSTGNLLVTMMAAHVGLDPAKDIHWVTDPSVKPIELFVQGKIDAFLGFPPEPQDLRARQIGKVIVSSAVDRPWSQYFCCMVAGNRDYIQRYPVATKRVLRAILKATDLCATDPASVARQLVDGGFTRRYDYALQTLSENSYDKWREYDAEDTVRFYALRLRDVGLIKSSPQKIIVDNSDWRFLDELKRELKA